MKFYKNENQFVITDKALTAGEEITANTTDGAHAIVISFLNDGAKSLYHPQAGGEAAPY